jgi:hypothetical protein
MNRMKYIVKSPKLIISKQESGMASILTTMIFVIIISLIILGFSQISLREQDEAVDRQLSTQAYYAAESGINDAHAAILSNSTNYLVGSAVAAKSTCAVPDPTSTVYDKLQPGLGNQGVTLTCLTVNPTPIQIFDENIPSNGKIIFLEGEEQSSGPKPVPVPIQTFTIGWEPINAVSNATYSKNCLVPTNPDNPAIPGFGQNTAYDCPASILEVDIVWGGNLDQSLTEYLYPNYNGTATAFPTITAASFAPTSSQQGQILQAPCTPPNLSPGVCNYTFSTSIVSMATPYYYIRVIPLSKAGTSDSLNVTGTCQNGLASATCLMFGDQAVIDSTADANGVLRRVQARLSVFGDDTSLAPASAITSYDSFCDNFYSDLTETFPNPYTANQQDADNCPAYP